MIMPPFTSAILFRLLFERLPSLNGMILPILQILHRLIIIYSPTWKNLFVGSHDDETIDTVEDYLNNLD